MRIFNKKKIIFRSKQTGKKLFSIKILKSDFSLMEKDSQWHRSTLEDWILQAVKRQIQ